MTNMITQDEIVSELRAQCAEVANLPILGWHFVYDKRNMVYIPNKNSDTIRICIPHIVKVAEFDEDMLVTAINETNREVRYVKVVVLDNGSVAVNYDHKCAAEDDVHIIIAHIMKALCFAADYLMEKLGR